MALDKMVIGDSRDRRDKREIKENFSFAAPVLDSRAELHLITTYNSTHVKIMTYRYTYVYIALTNPSIQYHEREVMYLGVTSERKYLIIQGA